MAAHSSGTGYDRETTLLLVSTIHDACVDAQKNSFERVQNGGRGQAKF